MRGMRYCPTVFAIALAVAGAACSVHVDEKKDTTVSETPPASATQAVQPGSTTALPASPAAAAPGAVAAAPSDTAAGSPPANAAPNTAATPANAPTTATGDMRLEVDLTKRQLLVYKGGQVTETHSVAVGSKQWPTQTGEWTIKQVVYNPEWIPPDETWAEEKQPRKPGDPKNPLGMAQLVYDPPRTIHGTDAPSSIGKPVSHGSIRMRNEDILKLAPEIMAAGGAPKDDAWIQAARANRTQKQVVDLPHPIPIRVF